METSQSKKFSVPQNRVREKVNEYMARRDYPGVERLLLYWLHEAEIGRDGRGKLMILCELIGHYRKTGEKDKGHTRIAEALAFTETENYTASISGAITYINAATAYNAFDENEKALPLFEKARDILSSCKNVEEELMGGLYNNMGLTLKTLGRYADAAAAFHEAVSIMSGISGGELEQAVSLLNLADTYCEAYGMPEAEGHIIPLLDRAESIFLNPSIPRNGYYAYVCTQSAPSFDYYGYFLTAEQLRRSADEIYDSTSSMKSRK